MKKILLTLFIIIPFFSISSISTNSQITKNLDTQSVKHIEKNINLIPESSSETFDNDKFLNFKGQNYDTIYRIWQATYNYHEFKNFAPFAKYEDLSVGRGKPLQKHIQKIPGLSLDITTLGLTKDQFLNKYQAITLSFIAGFVSWDFETMNNSNAPKIQTLTIQLAGTEYLYSLKQTGGNYDIEIYLRYIWDNNILNFEYQFCVIPFWQENPLIPNLIYEHISILTNFTNDMYTFVSVPNSEIPKESINYTDIIEKDSFSLKPSFQINLSNIDQKIKSKAEESKIKNAWFKTTTIMATSYKIKATVNKTTITWQLNIRWMPDSLANADATKLLNFMSPTRTITSTIDNDSTLKFTYKNSYDQEETLNDSTEIPKELLGTTLEGEIKIPIVYIY